MLLMDGYCTTEESFPLSFPKAAALLSCHTAASLALQTSGLVLRWEKFIQSKHQSLSKEIKALCKEYIFQAEPFADLSLLSLFSPCPQSFEIFLVNLDDKFFNFNLQQYMHEIQWIL